MDIFIIGIKIKTIIVAKLIVRKKISGFLLLNEMYS